MNIEDIIKTYHTDLDDGDKTMIDRQVEEKGIEQYLNQQLVYLDCSRIKDGMRMMQTIGYPYKREISKYAYVIETYKNNIECIEDWTTILVDLHERNLEYEKENPPIWYGGKKAKDKWDKEHGKHPRRKKVSEQTLPGMGKEISNKERLKKLSAQFGNLTFKIKPPKKD